MAAKVKGLTYAEAEAGYWATQPLDADAIVTSSGADVLGTSRVTLKWSRAQPTALREDLAMTSIWLAKIVGGGLYSFIPLAELAAREAALDVFCTGLMLYLSADYKLVEYAWHHVTENSPRTDDPGHRGQKMGPADRITVKSIAGSASGTDLPQQVSQTITLRTVSRRHWGRLYIPAPTTTALQGAYGRWTSAFADDLATIFNNLHNTWQDAGYQVGVWSQLHPAFMTPKQIETDDVVDVIRRRRSKQTGYRKILS